jgi:hypothetical protein
LAKFTLPIYEPLADPTPPDPADQTGFQLFTTENLPPFEGDLDSAHSALAGLFGDADAAASALDDLGGQLSEAFSILDKYGAEEDAWTFVNELAAASEQDAELGSLAGDVDAGLAALDPTIFTTLLDMILTPITEYMDYMETVLLSDLQAYVDELFMYYLNL